MPARIRFLERYGNGIAITLVGLAALVAFYEEGVGTALLSAGLVAAIAISVHAAERMAYVESEDEWQKAERREEELRRKALRLHPNMLENA